MSGASGTLYGPLRIVRRPRAFGATADASDKVKEWLQRLALMAPAEVTGFYLSFRPLVVGTMTDEQIRADALASTWPWVGFALAILVRGVATRRAASFFSGQIIPVGVAAIAFLLWVVMMGHYVAWLSDLPVMQDKRVPAILAGLFTFVVPIFYTGDPPPKPPPASAAAPDGAAPPAAAGATAGP